MKKEIEKLKNWLENATKIYMTDHEMNVMRIGEKTSEQCDAWEVGKYVQSQISKNIRLYLKIFVAGKLTQRTEYEINRLAPLDIRQP